MLRRLLLSVPVAAAFILFFPLLGRNQGKQVSYTGPVFEDLALKSGLTVPHISSPDKR